MGHHQSCDKRDYTPKKKKVAILKSMLIQNPSKTWAIKFEVTSIYESSKTDEHFFRGLEHMMNHFPFTMTVWR